MYIVFQGAVSVLAGEMPEGARLATEAEIAAYLAARDAGPDRTSFNTACAAFRQVCAGIGAAIGVSDFKGGFDEMAVFAASEAYGTIAGLQLANQWMAANELCKYEGGKIGLGQPEWWYTCWEIENNA